jgi:nucleoid-associated protein EbfC
MKGMFDMLKKAQEMQSKMGAVQAELAAATFKGQAGGGLVKVEVNGAHAVLTVHIKPEVLDKDDVGTLEDLIKVATNTAIGMASAHAEARMKTITGGLNIPGLTG